MNRKRFWKSWPAAAALCLLVFASPSIPQPVKVGPNLVVYESPT